MQSCKKCKHDRRQGCINSTWVSDTKQVKTITTTESPEPKNEEEQQQENDNKISKSGDVQEEIKEPIVSSSQK